MYYLSEQIGSINIKNNYLRKPCSVSKIYVNISLDENDHVISLKVGINRQNANSKTRKQKKTEKLSNNVSQTLVSVSKKCYITVLEFR